MPNTLTAVIPTLAQAANTVGRELVGFIPASFKNSQATRAGYNETINYPIVPTMTAASVTPSNVSSTGTDLTVTAGSIVMDNLRKVSWHFTGEQLKALDTGDVPVRDSILRDVFTQAARTLVNEIEASLWTAAYRGASRAYGTAGTTPFGTASDLSDFAGVQQILDDNGAPQIDRHLVVGSAAMANLRGKQSVLFKVNEAGTDELLRRGSIGEVMGLMIHNSYPIATHTKGTGTGYLINDATPTAGKTTIAADTGSGTIIAGDVVTFAGTSHKYIVNSALSGGSFAIGRPGLVVAETDNDAITVGNNYVPNVAFYRNALHLVMRAPDSGQDGASDEVTYQDPFSGLVFQLARYGQYMQSSWELRVLYGVKAVNSDFIATLMG